ncbi:putative lipoprotein [Xylaria nigripes]|nr:putative lipoprotein [Xylaria nigripes]
MRTTDLATVLAAACCVVETSAGEVSKKTPQIQILPSLREQADLIDSWTEERRALIPGLLRKYGVDAWLMSQREYAEDPVFWTLKNAVQFAARRRTTQLYLASPKHGAKSSYLWVDDTAGVWTELRNVLTEQQPETIALNTNSEIGWASGLHAGELNAITAAVGADLAQRFVLETMLPVEVVATMVPSRLPWYRRMQENAWAIIGEAFSEKVIVPGKTMPEDVEWWMRERLLSLNYSSWDQPVVTIMKEQTFPRPESFEPKNRPIEYGDYIHVDFGSSALGLNTDTQHMGYVLYPGETEADIPEGLRAGLRKVNRLQDIARANMKIGMTGNEILKATQKQMREEGIEGKIYSHAVGERGHSAGTVVGMTNIQDHVPALGDMPLLKDTYYSVELFAEHFIPEWNRTLHFPLEEEVFWDTRTKSWEWVYARQEEFLLVRTPAEDGAKETSEL